MSLRKRLSRAGATQQFVVGILVFAVAPLATPHGHAEAQSGPQRFRDRCVELGGDSDRCGNVVVGARAVAGQVALLSGFGSELPGSASTLGRRIGNQPRFTASFRAGGLSLAQPDLALASPGSGAVRERSSFVPALHLGLGAGVLDGFSPLPTVGGFLSLDVFASGSLVLLPGSDGFRDDVAGLTIGGRLGLLRESFTLPGVSVSVSRRFIGEVKVGDPGEGDPALLEVDPSVTAIRATVGKDLFGLGVLAGIGWDRGSADVVVDLDPGTSSAVRVARELDIDRTLYFGGLSMNFLLLQLSVEGGWAEGYTPLAGPRDSEFDPGEGSAFGSIALRFTP